MKKSHKLAGVAALAAGVTAITVPALSQKSEPPIARYTIDAGTLSGMAAMGADGANPLAMLRGGGNQAVHQMLLALGSSRTATGEPKADHFMPAVAGLGKSVPLITPRPTPTSTDSPVALPKGKLRLYWGCGENAPKGQPVVIDFAKMAKGQIPPGLFAQGPVVPDDWKVTLANSRTYGDWPNTKDSKTLKGNSSILGAHKVVSSYAPEINFTLADDFMPPLQPRSADMASGAVNLSWGALPKATGYYAWVIATNPESGDQLDATWWTSASTQQFGGFYGDWISPSTVKKLIDAKTVMPPTQTNCIIPKEVRQSGGPVMMTQLHAYGPQADFAFPPRPTAANAVWKPEWIARVRFRANAMVIHGMPGFGGMDASGGADVDEPQEPAGKPKCPRGLSGIGMRAAGLCE